MAKHPRKSKSDIRLLEKLGRAIRVARTARGLSQRELGNHIGKSQNLVFSIETGKKDPGILLLSKIAKALEMPLQFFLMAIQRPNPQEHGFLRALLEGAVETSQKKTRIK